MIKTKSRVLSLLLAWVLLFSCFCINIDKANAAVTWEPSMGTGYWWGDSGEINIMKVNGNPTYCVEPDQMVTTTKGYTETEPKFTASQWKRLILIAHFGYNQGYNSKADFAATQVMIWSEIWRWMGYTPGSLSDTNIPDLKGKIDKINSRINEYEAMIKVKPSFSGMEAVEIPAGTEYELKDTNKVLGKYPYEVTSVPAGVSVTIDKSNHSLKIKADESSADSGIINLTVAEKNNIPKNRFYYHSSSQNTANIGYVENLTASAKITVDKTGAAKITKVSELGKKISGAEFKVTSMQNGDTFDYITDENGEFVTSQLPMGTYEVSETKVPEPYILDKTPKVVTVKAGEIAQVTFTNDLPTGTFSLLKCDNEKNPLKGAKFRIWAEGDNAEGNKLNFDGEFETDEKGQIVVSGLELGKYHYQEIKAPEGYLIDEQIYDFEILYKDENTAIVEVGSEAVNNEPTGKITLKKTFKDFEKLTEKQKSYASLEGAEYGLYAREDITNRAGTKIHYQKDETVGKFVTDKEGLAEAIEGLPMGNYYVKEIKAPKGCLVDENEYDITLAYKDEITDTISADISVEDEVAKIPQIKTVKTDDGFPLGMMVAIAIGTLCGCIAFAIKRKD